MEGIGIENVIWNGNREWNIELNNIKGWLVSWGGWNRDWERMEWKLK